MKDYSISAIAVAVALVGGWYVFTQPQQTVTAPTQVMYVCDSGQVIDATFISDSVQLSFQDKSILKLEQTVSADGARYATADESLVFWSKGNGALVLQNGEQKDFKGCIAMAPVVAGSDLTEGYSSSKYGFSIRYPKGFSVFDAYTYSAGPKTFIPGVKLQIPPALAGGTNLGADSYMSIEVLQTQKDCSADLFLDGADKTDTVTANGVTYSVAETEGAGAGNRYAEVVYAYPGTNPCIAVRYWVHYSVFENYPAGSVTEFNKSALLATFERMRNTVVINQ